MGLQNCSRLQLFGHTSHYTKPSTQRRQVLAFGLIQGALGSVTEPSTVKLVSGVLHFLRSSFDSMYEIHSNVIHRQHLPALRIQQRWHGVIKRLQQGLQDLGLHRTSALQK